VARDVDAGLEEALAELLHRAVRYHAPGLEYATVVQASPLLLELHEGEETLSEDDGNLVVPKNMRTFAAGAGAGDTAVVSLMPGGQYVLHHLIDDTGT
jgi:hypothetical protein